MISKQTASQIWVAHNEIEKAEQLITDMKAAIEKHGDPKLTDAFGDRKGLQLGIPSGDSSHRIFGVSPELAIKVIEQHIAEAKKRLAEYCVHAQIELKG